MRYVGSCPKCFSVTSGYMEFYGFCPKHYAKLSAADRAILRGEEPTEVIERVVRVLSPRSRFRAALSLAWRLGMTGAVAWIFWRQVKGG